MQFFWFGSSYCAMIICSRLTASDIFRSKTSSWLESLSIVRILIGQNSFLLNTEPVSRMVTDCVFVWSIWLMPVFLNLIEFVNTDSSSDKFYSVLGTPCVPCFCSSVGKAPMKLLKSFLAGRLQNMTILGCSSLSSPDALDFSPLS